MAARIDDLERQVDSLGKALETTRTNLLSLASRSAGEMSGGEPEELKKSKKKSDKKTEKKALKSERRAGKAAVDRDVTIESASGSASKTDEVSNDSNPAIAGI
jgi:hypothetical protein